MKKALAGGMALMLLLAALSACTPKDENAGIDGDDSQSVSAPTNETIEGVLLFKAGEATAYRIVYEDDLGGSVQTAIDYAVERLNSLYEGIDLKAYPVSECPAEDGALEILIGDTDRQATADAEALLTADNEFVVKLFEDGTLVLLGTDENMLKKAVSYLMDEHAALSEGQLVLADDLEHHGTQKNRVGWKLSAPVYRSGELSEGAYDTGYGLTLTEKAGSMQVVRKTDGEEFSAYLERLSENGYTKVVENEINGNRYMQYEKDGKLLYTYYLAPLGEVRVIEDGASVKETDFEYSYTPAEGEKTVFYQFSLMSSHRGTVTDAELGTKYMNNGMFYILKLADDSVMLIDGGDSNHASDYTTEELFKFLCEITGTAENEKLRIACVFFTHMHGDHTSLTTKLIQTYGERLTVERAMYNIPVPATAAANAQIEPFTEYLVTNYPDIKFLKPHTGQSIQLCDATLDIVTAQEDLVDVKTGQSIAGDYNNYSTVLKITVNDRSVLLLGDWGGNTTKPSNYEDIEKYILAPYKTENGYDFLECDAVQAAHHCFNFWLGNVYAAVKAKVALLPTSNTRDDNSAAHSTMHYATSAVINQTRNAGAEHFCFHGQYLYELNFTDEGITVTANDPVGVTEAYKEFLASHAPIEP